MATAGTPEDENIENRPKNQDQAKDGARPSAGIGSITLLQGVDSEDEEELEEPETFWASAARIEKPQKKDDKWKNPTKILKRTDPQKEKKLAVPKVMRSGEWRPAIVTAEDMEVDAEDPKEEEAVLITVEDNLKKKKRALRA